MKKYIKIDVGSYRGQDMSGRVFPIIKDYQRFQSHIEWRDSPTPWQISQTLVSELINYTLFSASQAFISLYFLVIKATIDPLLG